MKGPWRARAVEPDHGKNGPATGDPEGRACLNCGATRPGNFCQNCGQKLAIHRSIAAIGHDLIHGVLHLDGKLWRTLPLLTFKPGKLTRRYIDGERAKFVSPMAMFLFSVFLMFAVFQMAGLSLSNLGLDDPRRVWDVDAARADIAANHAATIDERTNAQQELDAAEADQLDAEYVQLLRDQLNELDEKIAKIEEGQLALDTLPIGTPTNARSGNAESGANPNEGDGSGFTGDLDSTGIEFLDQGIIKKWRTNPGLMLYKLQTNFYKFSWLLIPLSLPFVWLTFFWKRRFHAYDHAVFVTYSLAFMSILFITLSLLSIAGIGGGWLFTLLAVVPPVHLYKQLRHTYDLGRFGALWRLVFLMAAIVTILLLFLQILVLLGAF